MPMIDVYATAGAFPDNHQLAADLAAAVMTIEQVPDIPMLRQNTAAFVTSCPPAACPTSTATPATCGSRSSATPARSIAASSWPWWSS